MTDKINSKQKVYLQRVFASEPNFKGERFSMDDDIFEIQLNSKYKIPCVVLINKRTAEMHLFSTMCIDEKLKEIDNMED